MTVVWNLIRVCLAAIIVVAVAEVSKRHPRYGALLLSLPIISFLAITLSWFQHHDLHAIAHLARETLILVPLGLSFFVPLVFASRLGFWTSLGSGIALALLTVGGWLYFAPTK